MNDYSCFIFDMDGTITNTNRLIFDSVNHIVERYRGGRRADREIAALFGPPEEGALEVIVGRDRLAEAMGAPDFLFRGFEEGANQWLSLRQTLKPLEVPRDGLEVYVERHARQVGIFLMLGGLYTLVLLLAWLGN